MVSYVERVKELKEPKEMKDKFDKACEFGVETHDWMCVSVAICCGYLSTVGSEHSTKVAELPRAFTGTSDPPSVLPSPDYWWVTAVAFSPSQHRTYLQIE